jgi:hypothetical protein
MLCVPLTNCARPTSNSHFLLPRNASCAENRDFSSSKSPPPQCAPNVVWNVLCTDSSYITATWSSTIVCHCNVAAGLSLQMPCLRSGNQDRNVGGSGGIANHIPPVNPFSLSNLLLATRVGSSDSPSNSSTAADVLLHSADAVSDARALCRPHRVRGRTRTRHWLACCPPVTAPYQRRSICEEVRGVRIAEDC